MVGQRSRESFDKWIQRHKQGDEKHGREEMQDFAERMGINRSVVPGMIERVRQAHRDIASGNQIAEYAKKIATYENWDKVIEAFQKDAFSDG